MLAEHDVGLHEMGLGETHLPCAEHVYVAIAPS
jgi:hypothetical protein